MTASGQPVDNLDALLDLSEYDELSTYQSPSLSPATTSKNGFTATARPSVSQATSPTMPTTSQPLTGPSHQYDMYKQQTGLVPGALASTLAVSNPVSSFNSVNFDYLGLSNEDPFDFNTSPSQGTLDVDMDFDSPNESLFMDTVSPNALNGQVSPNLASPATMTSQSSSVGRLYPGMHSQAALAKAQAQQRQQQQHMMLQQRQQQNAAQAKPRSKSAQATDPIVEQKITQLLNSMRAKPPSQDGDDQLPLMNIPRPRKDEDDMDEDERLLASEEGKKLTSKERRQLRNKVSARAFRSRRKEYITQLESEVQAKVNENGDLRNQNRALLEENKRLSDLTRMLLSSPSFSNFLDNLSASATSTPQQPEAPAKAESSQQQQTQQQRQSRIPKDINPAAYAAATQVQRQQIGMAMMPEQAMDFSMLNLQNNDASFNFQPQVFALVETPEMPSFIETSLLSGKESNFVGGPLDSDDAKVELPAIVRPSSKTQAASAPEEPPLNPEFEANPEFALFHASRPASPAEVETLSDEDIFGGIESEKVFARYELLDASAEERSTVLGVARIERLSDRLEPLMERLNRMTLY